MALADDIEEMDRLRDRPAKTSAATLKDAAAEMDAIRAENAPPAIDRSGEIPRLPVSMGGTPVNKETVKQYEPSETEKFLDYALAPLDIATSIVRSIPAQFLTAGPPEAPSQKLGEVIAGKPYTQAGASFLEGLSKFMDASKLGGLGPAEGVALGNLSRPLPYVSGPIKTGAGALEQQLASKLPKEPVAAPAPVVPPPGVQPKPAVAPVAEVPPKPGIVPPTATVPVTPAPAIPISAAEKVPALPTAAEVQDMLSRASPEVRGAIEAAALKGPVHVEAAVRQLESDSLPVPIKLTPGQATQNPGVISDEMNRRAKIPGLVDHLNEQNEALKKNLNAVREQVAPELADKNRTESGRTLIGEYQAVDDARKADISAKYKALEDANGGKFPLDGPTFADSALNGKKTRFLPAEIVGELEDIKAGKVPMTFESFEDLRTTLAAETRKAERASDGNRVYALSQVREALENIPMTAETAALKPLADEARAAAKARFDAIKRDPAYKAAITDPTVDDFVDKYVARADSKYIKEMVANLGDSEKAKQAIASGAINHLKKKAGILDDDTGNFASKSFRTELQNMDPKLDMLVGPEAAKTLRTLGKVSTYTTSQPKGSYVNNSNTLTGAIREGAVGIAEHGANAAAAGHGIPVPVGSAGRAIFKGRAAKKEAEQILKPGAGVEMKDLPK